MHALDSEGRQVSLLNDDEPSVSLHSHESPLSRPRLVYRTAASHTSYTSTSSTRSDSSSPMTPELIRSDSYDSRASNDPTSPLTPTTLPYEQTAHAQAYHHPTALTPYDDYPDPLLPQRPSFVEPKYEDDISISPVPPPAEKAGKRYPCRYRDSHGCDKTFTTSGHASRHSKIHTAEKAVQCTHLNCHKKFTRADNMKQHLETHYKDRSRSSISQRSLSSKSGSSSSSVRRSSLASSIRTSSSASISTTATTEWDIDPYQSQVTSPGVASCGAWDAAGLHLSLVGRPVAPRTPSGLDALAMAIACQENDGA